MPDEHALLAAVLGADGARALLPHLSPASLAPGERLLTLGQPSGWLFLVVEGELDVSVDGPGGRVELGARGPGSWLGEVGVIDGGPATANVEARAASRVLRLSREALIGLTASHPEVAGALLRFLTRVMGERLAQTSAGTVTPLAPGQVRVEPAPKPRSFWSRLFGGAE